MRSIVLASVILVFTAQFASAAVLRAVQGGVLVVKSNGSSAKAKGTRNVSPGDRVLTSGNGSAELVYPNGCIYQIPAGQDVRVRQDAKCNDDSMLVVLGGAAVVAGGAAIIIASDDDKPASP